MWTCSWRWYPVCLMVLALPTFPPPINLHSSSHGGQQTGPTCDRHLSAIARRLIHEAWLPIITQYPWLRLPPTCPIHPWRDRHGPAELAKLHYRVNLWTCAKCGKSFNGESDLETHIADRHPKLSEWREFSVCLADYCDIFRCSAQRSVTRRPWPVRTATESQSSQIAKAPSKGLVALLEGSETQLIEGPPSSSGRSDVRTCKHHQRGPEWRQKTVQRRGTGAAGSDSRSRAAFSKFEDDNEEWSRHGDNNADAVNWSSAPREASSFFPCPQCWGGPPKHCDPSQMAAVRTKCHRLLDTCVNQLILQLSDREWSEMKTDLSDRVCEHLTCEKFWERLGDRHKRFPGYTRPPSLGLLIVIFIVALIYLTFTYYVVWVCF